MNTTDTVQLAMMIEELEAHTTHLEKALLTSTGLQIQLAALVQECAQRIERLERLNKPQLVSDVSGVI